MAPTSSETRIGARLRDRRAEGRPLLVPYLTAGFPAREATPRLMHALAEAGADIIELGLPFSDPLADGPTIQGSSQSALDAGASVDGAFEALRRFRHHDGDTPVVLFTYLNPVMRRGPERFLAEAADAGADGVLITDLPLGEDPELEALFERSPLDFVRLIAPTTPPERALRIAARAQGFLYYISRAGVTGARSDVRAGLGEELAALRKAAEVPVVVGFGISTPAQAAGVAAMADGVVVGSALIDAIRDGGEGAAGEFIAGLRQALDAVSRTPA